MQQINLFHSRLRSAQHQISLKKAGYLLVISAAVFMFITVIQWWMFNSIEAEKQLAEKNKKDIIIEIKTISDEIAKISDDSELKNILVEKETELSNKQDVLQVLSGKRYGNTKGFAAHLTGLARQHIEGMWLTNLSIHHGGEKLSLQGSTFSPEHVPRYILNLSNEPSFTGVEFKTFQMQRNLETNRIDFDIRSILKEAG